MLCKKEYKVIKYTTNTNCILNMFASRRGEGNVLTEDVGRKGKVRIQEGAMDSVQKSEC